MLAQKTESGTEQDGDEEGNEAPPWYRCVFKDKKRM